MAATALRPDPTDAALPIGERLRAWRQRRRLSQLGLALDAEVSQRHLSFVESGRAAPSREMVLRLAAARAEAMDAASGEGYGLAGIRGLRIDSLDGLIRRHDEAARAHAKRKHAALGIAYLGLLHQRVAGSRQQAALGPPILRPVDERLWVLDAHP